ncbi:MAG: hypothetical protein MI974_17460 [Chitinophagales bacterium]|nr:hypothetical protein [Chitinophagales bacterium]
MVTHTVSQEANLTEDTNFLNKASEFEEMFGMQKLPYACKLSFLPLIEMMEEKADEHTSSSISTIADSVLGQLKQEEIFQKPIEDRTQLAAYPELMQLLMMMIIPPVRQQSRLVKISAPFDIAPIFCTSNLKEIMEKKKASYVLNQKKELMYNSMVITACSMILNKFYGQKLDVIMPYGISIQWPGAELENHYKIDIDDQFMEIVQTKPLKPLTQEDINYLLSNVYNLDLWLDYLPPENFEFHGFTVSSLIDITEENALSQLKFALLEREAVVEQNKVDHLEKLLRTYFKQPKLKMGITAIDYPVKNTVSHKYKIRFDFLADQQDRLLSPENKNSIYEKACKYKETVLIEDLEAVSVKTPIEEKLLAKGIKSIIVAPLFNKDQKVIGLLEIGSPQAYKLHSFIEIKFKEIVGLFSMAVERSREEIDNRVEAIIREQYTAVHPSIEWKFVETSYNLLEKREQNPTYSMIDPIVFNDVYPLYAQADIVSSSSKRNHAIQADLVDNLKRADKVLKYGTELINYPLLYQMRNKVEKNIEGLETDFNSNDESRIVEWLHDTIHPLFNDLRVKFPDLADKVASYYGYLDEDLGIVYRKRKAYEDSVTMVNNTISSYLEEQEKISQQILPHYFEKYKTDGVEYNMYIGQSLLQQGTFDMLHLRNLRLTQLIDMCEVTRIVEGMQDRLPVPITTAQLIFAYASPLSIRFMMEEKKFDVDGAYNVRYEILKKRIDKALIDGTSERLTQAGKIAIVYLQEKDRQEYLDFAEYLISEGYITDEIEDYKLGKLQGVHGLHALRFTVKI